MTHTHTLSLSISVLRLHVSLTLSLECVGSIHITGKAERIALVCVLSFVCALLVLQVKLTQSLLCVPLKDQAGSIVGAIQVLNVTR